MAEALPMQPAAGAAAQTQNQKVQKLDELPKTSLPLTENALRVLARRYLKKTEDSRPAEAPEDMLSRVAKNIAQADLFYDPKADLKAAEKEFYESMPSLISCPI